MQLICCTTAFAVPDTLTQAGKQTQYKIDMLIADPRLLGNTKNVGQMGKVQDTTSRIGRRRRHRSSPEIALIIPSQQKPSSHSFPTNYQAVADWLSAQTAKGIESGVAGLIKGLQHSNRLTNSPAERLKIMDLFAVEIQRTMPQLNTRYLGLYLPYSLSAQSAFEQTVTLLTELSYGYKIALVDVLLGRGTLTQKSRVQAIYQSMKAIAECGLRHSQSYTSWPDKSWRDINTLLLLAEHEGALDFPVATTSANKKNPATIHRLYAILATFAVSRPEQFKPHQMDALFTELNSNIDTFQLLAEKPQGDATTIYSVALNSAYPPAADRFSQYAQSHKIRYFTIKPIYAQTSSSSSEQNESTNLTHTHFNKLNQTWLQASPRQNARAVRHAPFYTQRGLKNIAASLNALPKSKPFDNGFSTAWTLVNESATGVGLQSTKNGNCSTCVGDLIAWQLERPQFQDNHCEVGIVRWLRCDSTNTLRIGLETIGQSVRTASIGKAANPPSQVDSQFNALLCKDATTKDEAALLLLPANKFRLGEIVQISIGTSKRISLIKLAEKLDQSGNVDCFTISDVPVSTDKSQSHSLHS